MNKKLITIVVTYNAMHWIDRCIGSLRSSSVGTDILVIDNGSSDGTVCHIREAFPEVTIMEGQGNIGFGAANNKGLRYALDEGYDFIYLMNQDAWIEPDTFRLLLDSWQEGFAILSPVQRDSRGNLDRNFSAKCGAFLKGDVAEVPFVMAAHWMMSRETVETVGGFSPAFTQYGEDDNYIDRLHSFGLKAGVVTAASAVHDRQDRTLPKDKRMALKCVSATVHLSNPSYPFFLRCAIEPLRLTGMSLKNLSVYPVRHIPALISRYGELKRYRLQSKEKGAFLP